MAGIRPTLTDQGRRQRQNSVDCVWASVHLEGFVLARAVEKITRREINGELTRRKPVSAIKPSL